MTTHRFTETIAPWIEEALDSMQPQERCLWEVGVMPMQAQGEVLPPEPTLVLLMWIPSTSQIGGSIGGMCPLPEPLTVNKEMIMDLVPKYVQHLREQRSRELESKAGLIVPS